VKEGYPNRHWPEVAARAMTILRDDEAITTITELSKLLSISKQRLWYILEKAGALEEVWGVTAPRKQRAREKRVAPWLAHMKVTGETVKQTAKAFGLNPSTVYSVIRSVELGS
jgi:hypothetical protein